MQSMCELENKKRQTVYDIMVVCAYKLFESVHVYSDVQKKSTGFYSFSLILKRKMKAELLFVV